EVRAALEQALADDPDDLASHSAYADFLAERGDPRGEFIQVQLALEGGQRPAEELERLRRREAELLARHARDWMGDAGRFLVGDWSGEDRPWDYHFRRGWLDSVRLLPQIDAALADVVGSPD